MSAKLFNLKNIFSSIVTLAIATVVYLAIPNQIKTSLFTGELIFGPRTLPYLLVYTIIILSTVDIFLEVRKNIIKKDTKPKSDSNNIKKHNYIGLLIVIVSIFLWIILVLYFGYKLATIFLVVTSMLVIGNNKWWQIIFLSLILSFGFDYFIKAVLRVYFPEGIFFG